MGQARPRAAGLTLFPYVLRYLRSQTITARAAILLAHVDRAVSPYDKRYPEECHAEDSEFVPWVRFSTEYLREILCATDKTVLDTIKRLRAHRAGRHLLKAERLDRCHWQLETREWVREESDADEPHLYVAAPVRKMFEAGDLTAMQMLALGLVASYTRRGQLCYFTNEYLGRFFGITWQRAKQLVRELGDKGFVYAEYPTKDQLRHHLAAHHQSFRGWGSRQVRVLWAKVAGLVPGDGDDNDP
jgi:hypothetical protein